MKWILFATLAAIFYMIHDYILKYISDKINPILSSFILSFSAFVILGVILLIQTMSGTKLEKINFSDFKTISFAGFFLALATISFIKTFENFAPFNIAIPYIYVVMIILGVIMGSIFLKEELQWKQIIGVGLCCLGLFLVVKK